MAKSMTRALLKTTSPKIGIEPKRLIGRTTLIRIGSRRECGRFSRLATASVVKATAHDAAIDVESPSSTTSTCSASNQSLGIQSRCIGALRRIREDTALFDSETINADIKTMTKQMRTMAVVLPFASASGVQALILVTKAVSSFISVYLLLLFIRVLLSWFPTFRWDRNPWMILRQVTDPYLNLFRGMVPPLLGTIDFTPLLGFFILQWLAGSLTISDEEAYW